MHRHPGLKPTAPTPTVRVNLRNVFASLNLSFPNSKTDIIPCRAGLADIRLQSPYVVPDTRKAPKSLALLF